LPGADCFSFAVVGVAESAGDHTTDVVARFERGCVETFAGGRNRGDDAASGSAVSGDVVGVIGRGCR